MQPENRSRAVCLFGPLYEFCFTPTCYHCRSPLQFGERRLCSACRGTLVMINPGDPLVLEMERRLCGDGLFDALCVLYRFEKGGALQTLLHELKYGGKTGVAGALGRELGERLTSLHGGSGGVLLPVPLHRVRRRERGYNQAELICAGIAEVTGWTMGASLVKRMRNTPTQTSLGIGERWENARGAFRLTARAGGSLHGRHAVLVDDLITTGATLRACGTCIRDAGVAQLTACGIALAALSSVS